MSIQLGLFDLTSADLLPPKWIMTTIGEVSAVNPRGSLAQYPDDLTVTFAPMAAVDAATGTLAAPKEKCLGEVRKGLTPFADGDVLFAKITPCMENGKAAIARGLKNGIGVGSTEFHVLRPTGQVLPEWLYYFVRQESFRRDAKASFAGTAGQLRVPSAFLVSYPIPLPPLEEQRRIVGEIGTQFARLDSAIASLLRVQANLRRYRAAVLKAACEGRLVTQDPNDEAAEVLLRRILAERRARWEAEHPGKKYVEPEGPDFGGLPELPSRWCWATVEQLAAVEPNSITDGPFGSNLKTEHYTSEGPRVVRLQNIGDCVFRDEHAHISEVHFAALLRHRVFPGDLVIAALGEEPPRACLIPTWLGPAIVKADCVRFKPHPRLLDARYANHALNSKVLKNQAARIVHGIGRPRLNQQEIKSLCVPLPSPAEQVRIIVEAEKRLSVVEQQSVVVELTLARAERLRQAVLKRAFEGRLGLNSR